MNISVLQLTEGMFVSDSPKLGKVGEYQGCDEECPAFLGPQQGLKKAILCILMFWHVPTSCNKTISVLTPVQTQTYIRVLTFYAVSHGHVLLAGIEHVTRKLLPCVPQQVQRDWTMPHKCGEVT